MGRGLRLPNLRGEMRRNADAREVGSGELEGFARKFATAQTKAWLIKAAAGIAKAILNCGGGAWGGIREFDKDIRIGDAGMGVVDAGRFWRCERPLRSRLPGRFA